MQLTAESFRQLWVPPGFGHGFLVLSEEAEVEYKCTDFYAAPSEIGIAWNDSEIGIEWPIEAPRLSAKDQRNHQLRDIPLDSLPRYE